MNWPEAVFGIVFVLAIGAIVWLTQEPACLWALVILLVMNFWS